MEQLLFLSVCETVLSLKPLVRWYAPGIYTFTLAFSFFCVNAKVYIDVPQYTWAFDFLWFIFVNIDTF